MWHFIVQVYGASGSRHEKANKEKVSSSRTTNHSLLGLPLCTHSRRELDSVSTMPGMYERFEQLIQRLQVDRDIEEWLHPTNRSELVKFIRSTETVRRLVSLVMTRQDLWLTHDKSDDLLSLLGVLQEIWPQLLELPHHRDACMDGKGNQFTYEISVVVPLYREDGVDLKRKLQMAIAGIQSHCHHDTQSARGPVPKIEFVLVNAGQCQSLDVVYSWLSTFDGKQTNQSLTSASTSTQLPPKNATSKNVSIRVHDYDRGGGRGPCLNYGAKLARGRILTFLHADTRLVPGWDVSILTAFSASDSNNSKALTTACAFSFGIDTSPSALSAHNNEAYFPPGIKAIERTANWRTHLFHLPYGDQCLSVPSQIFAYLGGHPDQCLLEDYELIRLLRQRVAITKTNLIARERLEILSLKAYCSPRRWQIYGVWFVTYMNSYVINRYAEGFTPDELFALYYGTPEAPPRRSAESPWELQLKQELGLYDQSNNRECMVD
jgi:glycosyltransferase involved in cell wall biosynthesis